MACGRQSYAVGMRRRTRSSNAVQATRRRGDSNRGRALDRNGRYPLANQIWFGVAVMLVGMGLVFLFDRRRVPPVAVAPEIALSRSAVRPR